MYMGAKSPFHGLGWVWFETRGGGADEIAETSL